VKRQHVRLAFAALVLIAIAAIGFITFFEEVPVTRHTPAQPEARRNPYLALERFMQNMGAPLARQNDARFLDALPPGGALLLDNQRRAHMTAARQQALLAWVAGGGRLLVAAEGGARTDPLLAAFKLSRWQRGKASDPKPAEADDDDEEQGSAAAPPDNAHSCPPDAPATPVTPADPGAWCQQSPVPPGQKAPPWPDRFSLRLPDAPRALIAGFAGAGLCPGEMAPEWVAGVPGFGAQVVHFRHGQGQITFFARGLHGWFDNRRIGQHDHAEMLWRLLGPPPEGSPVTLVTRLAMPTLGEWLLENAAPALAAGAALLLLWLWRVVPRFGPLQPELPPDRRQLREHLAAVGRHVWRQRGQSHWLAVAREAFAQKLASRHPALADLPPGEQVAALAALTHRPVALIGNALHGSVLTPHEFTLVLRTLKNLENSL